MEQNLSFEIEVRTTLAALTVQQENLSCLINSYLQKTMEQEVAASKMRTEIDTLFHNYGELKQEMKEAKIDIGNIIDEKIDSIYKMAGITAFFISVVMTIIGLVINLNVR